MPQGWSWVDVYAGFLVGRNQYYTGDMLTLKSQIAARLNRESINWGIYDVTVNDRPANDTTALSQGDVVKVFGENFSTLDKPKYTFVKARQHFIGVYVCSRCGGPLVSKSESCGYCGFHVDWSSIN